LQGYWQFQSEAGANTPFGGSVSQRSSEKFRPLFGQRETQADPAAIRVARAATESAENTSALGCGNSRSPIFDFDSDSISWSGLDRKPNSSIHPRCGILSGIVQEVPEHLPDHSGVDAD
jgi:hypothetical protein